MMRLLRLWSSSARKDIMRGFCRIQTFPRNRSEGVLKAVFIHGALLLLLPRLLKPILIGLPDG